MTTPKTLTPAQQALLARDDLHHSAVAFAAACRASREWSEMFSLALARYGNHGAAISGCGRNHFPDHVKDTLRALARRCAERCDTAHAARPHGVRAATIRKLGQTVATRDGVGFYGPQP